MVYTNTVLGPISPEKLGVTAIHEHLLFGMPGWEYSPKELFNHSEVFEKIKGYLIDFKDQGGQTLVDCTGISLGRDTEFYKILSHVTGINIVACTGFWSEKGIPGHFTYLSAHMQPKEPNYIAQIFIDEFTKGTITGLMRRTEIRAGIIVAGNSQNQITKGEETFYRAAAIAAKQTGAAVITHGSSMARRQLEILTEEGLDPNRIIIGQCDDSPDIERDKDIARKGAYVSYDHSAHNSLERDKQRVKLIKAMVEAGFDNQVLISCGSIGYGLDYPQPARPYSYLLSGYVPLLRQAGLREEIIRTMIVDNPARVLSY